MALACPSTTGPRYWWHTATIYELYPSSFKDSDGDGIGDIPGIISKIPYLASLGIDAVWLAACYKSGGVDMGYDVVDYRDIDPQYGTVNDIERLIEALANVGIRLIMDMVVNHTSDQHPWFKESRLSKESDKRDWYIWRKGKSSVQADGTTKRTPPNNWSSVFGGPAWTYDQETEEWYLHIFAKEQPDLNWISHEVRGAIYADMRFWLEMGVAGFRMDVINLISKPENLENRDAVIVDPAVVEQPAFDLICNGPRIHEYLHEMCRVVLDPYSKIPGQERMMVGEVICTSDPAVIRQYVEPNRKELNMAYQYDLFEWLHCGPKGKFSTYNPPISCDKTLADFQDLITKWQTSISYPTGGWGTIWLESHDTARSVSRLLDLTPSHISSADQNKFRWKVAKLLALLQTTLGGTLFVYQGQELGLVNLSASIPISEYRDIETKLAWETEYNTRSTNANALAAKDKVVDMSAFEIQIRLKARDHARAPLPWTADNPHAGFSDPPSTPEEQSHRVRKDPWTPMNTTDISTCNIVSQSSSPDSVLNFWRKCLSFRKTHADILIFGSFAPITHLSSSSVFAYWRRSTGENNHGLLIILNLTPEEDVDVQLPRVPGVEKHDGKLAMFEWIGGTDERGKTARARVVRDGGRVVLGAYEGVVLAC